MSALLLEGWLVLMKAMATRLWTIASPACAEPLLAGAAALRLTCGSMANPFEGHDRPYDLAPVALSAAESLGRSLGLPVAEPRVLSDGFWLMVHLAPAPVVARVSTYTARMRDPKVSLVREIAVGRHLDDSGIPVAAPTRHVDPGPHRHLGHHIGLWNYHERAGADPTMEDCLDRVSQLHAALAEFPGELATFGPVHDDLGYCLGGLDRAADLLSPDQLDSIRAAARRLEPFRTSPPGELTVVHGDLHPGNLLPTAEGPVWIDLEDVCRAPREWDLALLSWYAPADRLAGFGPDPEVLELCRDLRALHILAGLIRFRGELGQGPEYDAMITGALPLLTETRQP